MHGNHATVFDDAAAEQLVRAFQAGTLDPDGFHHVDHVQLTWALLRRMPLDGAIDQLRDGLKRLVASVGKPDRYHETITVFFATQIHERMSAASDDEAWAAFAERNGEVLDAPRAFMWRFYREQTLQSDAARLGFVPPDFIEDDSIHQR